MIIPFAQLSCIMASKCLFTVLPKTKKISNSNSDSQNLKQNEHLSPAYKVLIYFNRFSRAYLHNCLGWVDPTRQALNINADEGGKPLGPNGTGVGGGLVFMHRVQV